MSASLATLPPPLGEELLDLIQLRLPQLSPLMRAIGSYCVRMHAWLHEMSIEEVASQCGTVPSSIVRFARLFGHRGYHDFKLAFLGPRMAPQPPLRPLRAVPPSAPKAESRLLGQLDEDVYQLSALREILQGEAFVASLDWIRSQPRIVLTYQGERDRMFAMHLGDALQRVGKIVLLTDPMRSCAPQPWQADAVEIQLDLDRVELRDSFVAPSSTTPIGRCIELRGTDRLQQARIEPRHATLPVFGSTLGRRLQKALSIADTVEAALQ